MSRVVVLVQGQEGLCFPSGPATRVIVGDDCASLPVCILLRSLGVRPTTVDTLQQDPCSVMVIMADIDDGANLDLLRQRLGDTGRAQGLVLRIQREDVFRAMHRI